MLEEKIESLINSIDNQTLAISKINDSLHALNDILGAQVTTVKDALPKVESDTIHTTTKAPKATKKAPTPEEEARKTLEEMLAEADAEEIVTPEEPQAKLTLPEGKRDKAYFMEHIRPVLLALGEQNKAAFDAIKKEVAEPLGLAKLSDTPPDCWDRIFELVQQYNSEV